MKEQTEQYTRYKRSRFSARLPIDRLYTASHCWLLQQGNDLWRVGFTPFATRMLGEPVEHEFEIKPDEPVKVGQIIGWMEGFKAASDVYCVAEGAFVRGNPELEKDVSLVKSDPFEKGWLYEVNGNPEPNAVDVAGYQGILDAAIDAVQGKQHQGTIPQNDGNE